MICYHSTKFTAVIATVILWTKNYQHVTRLCMVRAIMSMDARFGGCHFKVNVHFLVHNLLSSQQKSGGQNVKEVQVF